MQIKGKNQHVIPNSTGWCVIDEANQMVVQHFKTQADALEFAQKCATTGEGEVLVHTSPCVDLHNISTVALPQREYFPGQGYVDMNETTIIEETTKTTIKTQSHQPQEIETELEHIIDPEEYYYDL
jgi:hypothetical protein